MLVVYANTQYFLLIVIILHTVHSDHMCLITQDYLIILCHISENVINIVWTIVGTFAQVLQKC